ncbi:hypothetical protein LSAT2_011585 [Lamellibrachia satsuma]|nr:hypothetical protein LSAT2_011585 [Lamellibrachia satsuma]
MSQSQKKPYYLGEGGNESLSVVAAASAAGAAAAAAATAAAAMLKTPRSLTADRHPSRSTLRACWPLRGPRHIHVNHKLDNSCPMWPATIAIHPWDHVDRGLPNNRLSSSHDSGHSAAVTGAAVMVTSGGSSTPTCKHSLQTLKKWAELHGNIHDSNLQVLQTFVQPVHVRAVCHSKTQQNHATVVALHKSAHTEIRVWLQRPENSHLKRMTFVIKTDIQKMIFLENHKLFAAYCKDMTLRMYSDYQYGFKEVSVNCCRQTVLCMAYSGETNELFGGGVGCVLRWEVAAVSGLDVNLCAMSYQFGFFFQLSGALKVLRPCDINFAENEIIQHMSVNSGYQTLVIHTHFNVYIWNYMLQVHLHKYEICQDPSLTCVVFHPPEDLIITASVGGNIQVWSWAGQFTLLNELAGHNNPLAG